jgi:hypothetical protein
MLSPLIYSYISIIALTYNEHDTKAISDLVTVLKKSNIDSKYRAEKLLIHSIDLIQSPFWIFLIVIDDVFELQKSLNFLEQFDINFSDHPELFMLTIFSTPKAQDDDPPYKLQHGAEYANSLIGLIDKIKPLNIDINNLRCKTTKYSILHLLGSGYYEYKDPSDDTFDTKDRPNPRLFNDDYKKIIVYLVDILGVHPYICDSYGYTAFDYCILKRYKGIDDYDMANYLKAKGQTITKYVQHQIYIYIDTWDDNRVPKLKSLQDFLQTLPISFEPEISKIKKEVFKDPKFQEHLKQVQLILLQRNRMSKNTPELPEQLPVTLPHTPELTEQLPPELIPVFQSMFNLHTDVSEHVLQSLLKSVSYKVAEEIFKKPIINQFFENGLIYLDATPEETEKIKTAYFQKYPPPPQAGGGRAILRDLTNPQLRKIGRVLAIKNLKSYSRDELICIITKTMKAIAKKLC